MRRLFVSLYLITALLHVGFAVTIAVLLGSSLKAWIFGASLGAALAVAFHGRVALLRHDRKLAPARRLLEELYYLHWCALPIAAVVVPGLLLAAAVLDRSLQGALGAGYASALALSFWGVVVRRRWLRVAEIDVVVPALPPAFDGYRIVQLSDLHLGSLCPRRRVEGWAARAAQLRPDLIVLTGDFVTSGVAFHADIAQALASLEARDGVFAVMGNHDYYGEGEPLLTLLRQAGITVLRNERVSLIRGGERLELAGVDDVYTRRFDLDATLAGFSGGPLFVLAHDPVTFPELAAAGAALVLSGHTHWGQIGLPGLAERINYARALSPFAAGRHRIGSSQLYVHPGLGTTGPPIRIGVAPTIAVITLRARPWPK